MPALAGRGERTGVICVTNDQFRVLEEISGNRSPSTKAGSKADDLLAAAVSAFAGITRPGRQDMQQFEDLVMPLLHCAGAGAKRQAASALAQLDEAPRRVILALAGEPVEISAPLLLRSPLLRPGELIDLIGKHGLAHARVIARRQSGDALLGDVLRSFADPAIDRMLALQEDLANIDTPPVIPATNAQPLAHALEQPFFTAGTLPGPDRLIETALLIDGQFFRNALADALDLTFERAEAIIGQWPDSRLPIALKALGLSAAECFLTMSAVLGNIDASREALREFVHLYRSIDRQKAMALVRRWKEEDLSAMLRSKLREMADDVPLADAANSDAPATLNRAK